MSEAEIFAKTLKIRDLFKRLSQLTWGIREAEQKFNMQTGAKDLLFLYEGFLKELFEIADQAKEGQP